MNFTDCKDSKKAFDALNIKFNNSNPDFPLPCPGINFINFDLESKIPYYLEGSTINNNYSYFDFILNLNKNLINRKPNRDEILEKFKDLRFKIFYSNVDMDVDGNNYTALYYTSFLELQVSTDNFISGKLGFMQNEITEDTNYIASDLKSSRKEYLLNDDAGNSFDSLPQKSIQSKIKNSKSSDDFWNSNESLDLLNIKIRKTKNLFKYIIQYKKLPSLIAQSGGILNAIVVFIKISASLLMDYQFYSKILQLTLDIDYNSTKISEDELKEDKVNTSKKDGGERLKKLFSEINFIQIDKKKSSFGKSNKNNSNSSRKINDQTDLELNNHNESMHNDNKENNYCSPAKNDYNKNDEILDHNQEINMKMKSKNDGGSQNSEFMDAERANKFNSYLVAAEKAKHVNGGPKKKAKKKDDVFFKDNIFNFIDFVYDTYKYCSRSKIQPIGYIKVLENRNLLYEKSKNNFYKNFEINNIIKKNIEIDLIKFLLMSSDQLNLYRLVKKPLISFKNTDLSAFDKAYDEFSQDRLYSKDELRNLEASKKEEIKKSFLNIHEKKQSNVVNRKLLRMVEDRISLFLDE